jgi:colanic acid biosynthesis glycosyl transferase WcaI
MKLLINGINFAPELTGIGKYTGELVEWLAMRGHDVTVVTTVPYYPQRRVEAGYDAWRWSEERFHGARVIRCPVWIPSRPTGLRRLTHLASFALSSAPVMVREAIRQPDLVLVIEPPLLCAPMAAFAAYLAGGESWLHVQDFEVDAAFSLGLMQGRWAARAGHALERQVMELFSRVSTISPRMLARLRENGLQPERVALFCNWVDTDAIVPLDSSPYRYDLGIPDGAVVALFSGSMTKKQGLGYLAEAALRLAHEDHLYFVLCGEGLERSALSRALQAHPNARFLPLQPAERLNELLSLADIHLLPQLPGAADLVMPSKLQGMFASGRPVVATAEPGTQIADAVAQRGIVVAPGDIGALASAINALGHDRERRIILGQAARRYALQHWSKQRVLADFDNQLRTFAVAASTDRRSLA